MAETIVHASSRKRPSASDWRRLWLYRDLFYFLVRRDIAVRYKQAVLGLAWAIFQPVIMALVFTLVFGALAGMDADGGVPYPVFVLAGLTIFTFVTKSITISTDSTVMAAPMITKVAYPRILTPVAAIGAPIIDFALGFVVLEVLAAAYGVLPNAQLAVLPLILLMALLTACGAGVGLSALVVRYRDVQQIVQLSLMILLFASPVIYPITRMPEAWRPLWALNPLVGIIDGFRYSIIPSHPFPGLPVLAISGSVSAVICLLGVAYFQRSQRTFADVI